MKRISRGNRRCGKPAVIEARIPAGISELVVHMCHEHRDRVSAEMLSGSDPAPDTTCDWTPGRGIKIKPWSGPKRPRNL